MDVKAAIENTKYYLNKNGKMQTGWQKIGGKWYYMDKNGALQESKWISGIYYVKVDGSMAVSVFLYQTYIQDIIYEERLNQMEEITHQMFQNLEDVIDSHWDRVTEEHNYLKDANIQTTDELCKHMKKKYELSAYADHKITLMAVDSEGGYYTGAGNRGHFRDLDYFEESPEKISFVFDSMTDNQSKMVFLNRLPEPIDLQDGEKKTSTAIRWHRKQADPRAVFLPICLTIYVLL